MQVKRQLKSAQEHGLENKDAITHGFEANQNGERVLGAPFEALHVV